MSEGRFELHARRVASLTVVSRVLGLARDAVFSRVFGDSAAMSAFFTAFIIPNIFRRLFGEGALSAAFIPEYAQLVERDRAMAARFASLTVAMLTLTLGVLTVVVFAALAGLRWLSPFGESGALVFELGMVMLPFMPLVCLTAILGGMLQTHGRFAPHAGSPIILNLCMIGAATVWGVAMGRGAESSVWAVAVAVVIAGSLQLAWAVLALRAHIDWTLVTEGASGAVARMLRRMGPVVIGMGALQLGTFIDALIAGWPVMVGETVPFTDASYPLSDASASLMYYAQRLYQCPLGVFGVAIATAVFPVLSREAHDPARFARTLRRGVRLCLYLGLPAGVGLFLVREPLTLALYAGGEFGADETREVARIITGYAPSVWAYAMLLLLTRAYYAMGDASTPMRTGLMALGINIVLSLSLIWWVRELGIALSTAIGANAQCLVLIAMARKKLLGEPLFDRAVLRSLGVMLAMTGAMGMSVLAVHLAWPASVDPLAGGASWSAGAIKLGALTGTGIAVYLGLSVVLKREELAQLLHRSGASGGDSA